MNTLLHLRIFICLINDTFYTVHWCNTFGPPVPWKSLARLIWTFWSCLSFIIIYLDVGTSGLIIVFANYGQYKSCKTNTRICCTSGFIVHSSGWIRTEHPPKIQLRNKILKHFCHIVFSVSFTFRLKVGGWGAFLSAYRPNPAGFTNQKLP